MVTILLRTISVVSTDSRPETQKISSFAGSHLQMEPRKNALDIGLYGLTAPKQNLCGEAKAYTLQLSMIYVPEFTQLILF